MRDENGAIGSAMISVAMCTYNGARFVEEQLESILRQSYRNLEIVIVDDASSDDTAEILKRFQERDSRIRLLFNEQNLGFLKSFERAMSESRGDFIALADQDDVWLEHKIETLYREIGDNLLVYSNVSLIDEQGTPIDTIFPIVNRIEGRCALSLVMCNCVTGHACLIRRELLNKALPFPYGVVLHDQWLAIVAAASGRLKASSEYLSLYRKHDNNAVLKKKRKRTVPKYVKKEDTEAITLNLANTMLSSGLFSNRESVLLNGFVELLKRNRSVFYNGSLEQFLLDHQEDFLQLYQDKKRYVHKLCRGSWYFKLVPFA